MTKGKPFFLPVKMCRGPNSFLFKNPPSFISLLAQTGVRLMDAKSGWKFTEQNRLLRRRIKFDSFTKGLLDSIGWAAFVPKFGRCPTYSENTMEFSA